MVIIQKAKEQKFQVSWKQDRPWLMDVGDKAKYLLCDCKIQLKMTAIDNHTGILLS